MLRFIFGGAGSGKTRHLLQEVIDRSVEEPGTHFIIVVPDQYTMEMQSAVVRSHPSHATTDIDVVSFGRLTHRVFDEVGAPAWPALDDTGKSLILRRVAGLIRDDLPVIGGGMRRPGYIDNVKSTISEFMQYGISPAGLEPLIEASATRPALMHKLRDLQRLYAAFTEHIREHYTTPEETLLLLCDRLPESELIKGSVVMFDGFTGFTPVQRAVIRTLLGLCAEVCVSLTTDGTDDPYHAQEGDPLFMLSYRCVRQLLRLAWEVDEERGSAPSGGYEAWAARRAQRDVILSGDHGRHEGSPALHFMERHLMRYDGAVYCGADGSDAAGELNIFEAADRRSEVQEVLRRIWLLTHPSDTDTQPGQMEKAAPEASPAYRDIAVICGSLEEYADLIQQEAVHYGIPVYIDRTKALKSDPFINSIRAALQVVTARYSYESVFGYLRGGLSPFTHEQTDELDNYVRALGIRGSMWERPFIRVPQRLSDELSSEDERLYLLERMEGMRQSFMQWFGLLGGAGERSVKDRAVSLYDFICATGMVRRLEEWEERLRLEGDEVRAREYSQVPAKVAALLDQLVELMGDEVMPLKEFMDILDAGLSDIQVGTIPQSVDRVMVGDLERTRLKQVRYLFFMGAGDDVIPGASGTGGVISDMDRQFLTDRVPEVELAPTPAEQMQTQQLYLYMTLTRPESALTISYVRSSSDGRALRPSYLVGMLRGMFPSVTVRDPAGIALEERLVTRAAAGAILADELRSYAEGTLSESEIGALRALCHRPDDLGRTLMDAAFIRYRHIPLEKAVAQELYGIQLHTSVSRLEQYHSCAFAHFARYGLGLKERAIYEVSAADLGNVYHGALESFTLALQERATGWEGLSEEERARVMSECLAAEAAAYGDQIWHSTGRMEYRLGRLNRILLRTVDTLTYQLSQGDFAPTGAEVPFSLEPEGVGGLTLHGRIDRLDSSRDAAGNVRLKLLDFKSSRHSFDLNRFYYGQQLQLMVYMEAAVRAAMSRRGAGEVTPSAMLYYRIADPMIGTDPYEAGKVTDAALTDQINRELRTTGLVIVDGEDAGRTIGALDKSLTDTQTGIILPRMKSMVIPVETKTDGSFTAASQVVERSQYETLRGHMFRQVREAVSGIRGGDIAVSPSLYDNRDSACTYCPYRPVCGMDRRTPGYEDRKLVKRDKDTILADMERELRP